MNQSGPDFPDDEKSPADIAQEHAERYNRIAEAAYLRAAARGFVGGDPMQDWLDAESDLMKAAEQESVREQESVQDVSTQQESMR